MWTSASPDRAVTSWALYDWANSAFATAVMAGFFPVFFRQYWSHATDVTMATFRLGLANTLASLFIALSAPLLGAASDRYRGKKRFLMGFAFLGVVTTSGLCFIPSGRYGWAMALYILAVVGFMGGNIFYDSLLLDVAPSDRMDRVSALGYALGYMGGGLFLAGCIWMVMRPGAFGFSSGGSATRATFLLVAAWWGIFSVPLFLYVDEKRSSETDAFSESVKRWYPHVAGILREIRVNRQVVFFLIGYWLYIDGVGTVIRMAVDFGMAIGLKSSDLILALLVTQFVGFPATLGFGRLGEGIGPKRAILTGLGGYMTITVGSLLIHGPGGFFALAIAVGLVQGGVLSLSRSFFARLVPPEKSSTYFGVYNMLGRFAAVLGPFLMGAAAYLTKSPRMGIISVGVLFLGGAIFLGMVRESEEKI